MMLLKRYLKRNKIFLLALVIAFISVILALCAVILDELSGLTHFNAVVYCGHSHVGGIEFASDLCTTKGCDQAEMAGILWLFLMGLGFLVSLAAPLFLKLGKSLIWIPCLFAAVLYLLAICLWLSDNPICYSGIDTQTSNIGASIYLALAACVIAMMASVVAGFAARRRKK